MNRYYYIDFNYIITDCCEFNTLKSIPAKGGLANNTVSYHDVFRIHVLSLLRKNEFLAVKNQKEY